MQQNLEIDLVVTLPNSNYVTFSDTFKAKRDILGIYMDIFKDKILDIIVVL